MRLAVQFFLTLALFSRADESPARVLPDINWKPVFQGVEQAEFALEKPRIIKAFLLRIDLKAEGIEFLTTPSNGEKKGETDGLKTSSFLKNHQLQAAINAAPFSPVVQKEGEPENVSGLAVSQGETVSPKTKDEELPSLILTKQNKARIVKHGEDASDAWNAVSGFNIVLEDGEVQPSGDDLHPRTAAGISKDGRHLLLLVVDGRQRRWSSGATTQELGAWLKELGCHDGINLDGGGTSTLVLEGEDGKPNIVNRPIHLGIPGHERVSASHLGLKAKPLKKAEE